MYKKLQNIDWKEVEAFFYQAMLGGWATGENSNVDPYTGYKTFSTRRTDLPYSLVDRWTNTPESDLSSGTTTICWAPRSCPDAIPIWTMHYGGLYVREATTLVKDALKHAYQNPRSMPFMGCRGPMGFKSTGIVYQNLVDYQDTVPFRRFSGTEKVVTTGGLQLGYHQYFGMSLI